ncbi:hypothetical protein SRM_02398 [Salinibacter ruber M8]|uniref:Uncharacterized protein n=1 Tax=Salinibacter ruber (strain M8) TaxID=761659 RepID=D5HBB4_SALRM|nr:hypothetical protein SRM_02398 [Salinibacter ruber M8]
MGSRLSRSGQSASLFGEREHDRPSSRERANQRLCTREAL